MENQTITKNVLELPILKHFDESQITADPSKWKPGEKAIAIGAGAVLAGLIGYGMVAYALPAIFTAFGKTIASLGSATMVIGFFTLLPVINKAWRRVARFFHRLLIKYDPFGELEEQKQKMLKNREEFKNAKAKIRSIKTSMEVESVKAERESKQFQEDVVQLQSKAETIKHKMQEIEKKLGAAAKESDDYVELQTELMRILSQAQRVSHQLNQSTGLVSKYGSRANVIGKLERKLNVVDTAMEIKIADFDVSIDMLRKEYDFAKAAKNATDQAKSAMRFSDSWELEYALDVVQNTVALDLAATHINLADLDTMTSQYSLDSDELYTKLDVLADKIKTDKMVVPESKKYSNPNYKLTSEDKANSGGFEDIF